MCHKGNLMSGIFFSFIAQILAITHFNLEGALEGSGPLWSVGRDSKQLLKGKIKCFLIFIIICFNVLKLLFGEMVACDSVAL